MTEIKADTLSCNCISLKECVEKMDRQIKIVSGFWKNNIRTDKTKPKD